MGSRTRRQTPDTTGVPPVVRYWREGLPGSEPAPPRIRVVDTCAGHRPRTGGDYPTHTDPDNAR